MFDVLIKSLLFCRGRMCTPKIGRGVKYSVSDQEDKARAFSEVKSDAVC